MKLADIARTDTRSGEPTGKPEFRDVQLIDADSSGKLTMNYGVVSQVAIDRSPVKYRDKTSVTYPDRVGTSNSSKRLRFLLRCIVIGFLLIL